ncbi:MAG: hypothetical protein ACFFCW_14400 [Candidatus Hodarchaeota archaeon]
MEYIWDDFLTWLGYQFNQYPILTILEAFYFYCHPDRCGKTNKEEAAGVALIESNLGGRNVTICGLFVEWMDYNMTMYPFETILKAFYYYCHPWCAGNMDDAVRHSPERAAQTVLQSG